MNVFFIGDTHFNHNKVIEYSNRPFNSLEEMNERLIENWNSVVRSNDIVYHLGDFAFYRKQDAYDIFERLKGIKVLIRGNHDSKTYKYENIFSKVVDYLELTEYTENRLILSHYPFYTWRNRHKGSLMIHGHTHLKTISNPVVANRLCVSVEATGYFPISLEELMQFTTPANELPLIDYNV